jgi:hypothetical protein
MGACQVASAIESFAMLRILTAAFIAWTATAYAQPVETHEIALQCGAFKLRINPVTAVVYSGPAGEPFRSRSAITPDSIVIDQVSGTFKMRIDRKTNAYSLWTYDNHPKGQGTCSPLP